MLPCHDLTSLTEEILAKEVLPIVRIPVFLGVSCWVEESRAGLPSDQVRCVRNFTLTDGGHLRERLLSFSDLDHAFTYSIIVSPMPIENYVATFRHRC